MHRIKKKILESKHEAGTAMRFISKWAQLHGVAKTYGLKKKIKQLFSRTTSASITTSLRLRLIDSF